MAEWGRRHIDGKQWQPRGWGQLLAAVGRKAPIGPFPHQPCPHWLALPPTPDPEGREEGA